MTGPMIKKPEVDLCQIENAQAGGNREGRERCMLPRGQPRSTLLTSQGPGALAPSSVTGSRSTTLLVKVPTGTAVGSSTLIVTATSGSLSHQDSGSLIVSPSGPTAVSVSPSSGSGTSQAFSFQFSDSQGYTNLSMLWFGFGSSPYNGCIVQYTPGVKALYLEDDTGTVLLGPSTPGVSGTVSNSQCTLNAGTSSVSGSGNTLIVKVALSFKPAFAGLQNAYMYAVDASGLKTPAWQNRGTWLP